MVMCKPGVCWFKINIILCLIATLTCLSCYLYYEGPPQLIDAGMRLIYITTIASIFVSIICTISLTRESRSTFVIIICNIGLVFVFIVSAYAHYCFEGVQLDTERMKEYTQNYFQENGSPPPFLDSVQRQMKCCGIYGTKDYIETLNGSGHLNKSFLIPASCCVSENNCIMPSFSSSSAGIWNKSMPAHSGQSTVTTTRKSPIRKSGRLEFLNGVRGRVNYLVEKVLPDGKSKKNNTTIHLIHSDGCGKFLDTIESFLSSLSEKEKTRDWLTLPVEVKDVYLRFITVYNFVLLFVFNYHLTRHRFRRRPAVIPRAPPPIEYEGQNVTMESHHHHHHPFPFFYGDGGSGSGGGQPSSTSPNSESGVDMNSNLARPPFRPRTEFLHPFMLSAMMHQQQQQKGPINIMTSPQLSSSTPKLVKVDLGDQGNSSSRSPPQSVNYSSNINDINNNNTDFTPSAPPAYNPMMH